MSKSWITVLQSLVVAGLVPVAVAAAGAEGAVDHAREGTVAEARERAPLERQNFGVILQTFASPDARPSGLGFDGTHLWLVTDSGAKTIWKLDPSDGSVVDSFPAPAATFTFGLDHNGFNLWGDTDGPDEIYGADAADGEVRRTFPSPFTQPNGVAWDGADLWHSGFQEPLRLIDDRSGSTIRAIPAPGNSFPRDMAWDGTTLWVVDANLAEGDAIYRIDPADGSVELAFLPVGDPLAFMYGLAFDGKYLWLSDLVDNQIHKIELALHLGIWVSGSCPGPAQVRLFGETPNGRVALVRGTETGSFIVPGGPCAGTELGIADPSLVRVLDLDENGEATLSGNLGPGPCGQYLQALDVTACFPSVVSRLPRQ